MTLPLFPSYREIPLTKGQVAIVDDDDYEWLSEHNWYAAARENGFYAQRSGRHSNGKKTVILMHREIMGLKHGNPIQVDHRNTKQTLDNRKSNLRFADSIQQGHNKPIQKSNTSGFKGVSWHSPLSKWRAAIRVGGKKKHLGYFDTPEAASAVYRHFAESLHGEFANFE